MSTPTPAPAPGYHPSNDVQAVMVGELNITRELYSLIIKKADSTNPNKALPGVRFLVSSENGSYSKEVVTGSDGTVTVPKLEAGTYAVTELEAPEGYEIDNTGPQYAVLPNGTDKTVTVTFADSPEITGYDRSILVCAVCLFYPKEFQSISRLNP